MRRRRPHADTKAVPLDPIALSIAIWLGIMVTMVGLQRISAAAPAPPTAPAAAWVH